MFLPNMADQKKKKTPNKQTVGSSAERRCTDLGPRSATCLTPMTLTLRLLHCHPAWQTAVSTEPSYSGLWTVLLQHKAEGMFQPATYTSRSLTKTERQHTLTGKEALPIVLSLEHRQIRLVETFMKKQDQDFGFGEHKTVFE